MNTKLFHYTDEEEFRIEHAKRAAKHFMQNYGKGERTPLINLKHYCNTC